MLTQAPSDVQAGSCRASLADRYVAVRARTEALCAPLCIEDYGVQPMEDASPPKWHLAHTAWFFETFLLRPCVDGYEPFDSRFESLFNSYYNSIGNPFPRPRRGHLSRPTVAAVRNYRRHVDAAMHNLLQRQDGEVGRRIELGLQHEQQHQELLLTDLKANLGQNPLKPVYRDDLTDIASEPPRPLRFLAQAGGLGLAGAMADGFCFDNELPRHKVWLAPFALADRLITNGEFLEFMRDGGYRRPDLWLAEGWRQVCALDWRAPFYWREQDDCWFEYGLGGERALALDDPVVHVSGFEADAYSRWAGARLPTELEWEAAAVGLNPGLGNFVESDRLHPGGQAVQQQMFGDVWEWTASAYAPYPGYRPLAGALGEYNGKFMSSQWVLRGGSCATPAGHVRASYRNFFFPADRWQFSGIRLARDETA